MIIDRSLEQSATIAPGSDQTFVDGGVYTAIVTVDVSEKGLIDRGEVSQPQLELNVSGQGVSITSISSSSGDYDVSPSDPDCRDGCQLASTNAFGPASQHTVLVRFALDSSVATDSVTIGADPTPDKQNGDGTTVSYDVVESASSTEQLAEVAEAQARLATGYNKTYDRLLYSADWDDRVERRMGRAFTIVANDAAMSIVTSYADEAISGVSSVRHANNLETYQNAQTVYGMSQNSFGSGTTVGKIARVNNRLYLDLQRRMDIGSATNAGNSSYALRELARLSREEAEAWRAGDRERVRQILYKKQYVLMGYSKNVPASYKLRFEENFDGAVTGSESPSLYHQSRSQRIAVSDEGSSDLYNYFDAVHQYAKAEYEQIDDTVLPMARDPSPHVRLNSSQRDLQSRLANLEQGETMTVTFHVSNGENAGLTSSQGYLSVSHADTLNVTGFEQVDGDTDVAVVNSSVGDEIFYRNGTRRPAKHPLTDIREPYDPGETNTYRLTLKRTSSSGDAWVAYRTAFQPLIHDEEADQTSFIRYPRSSTVDSTDQQNWAAVNVTEDPAAGNQSPVARISVSPSSIEAGDMVTLDSRLSSDDTAVESATWRVDIDDDGTRETRAQDRVTTTFGAAGTKNITLTVTDAAGMSDRTTTTITVSPAREVTASFEANRTIIEPGNTTELRATTTAQEYAWDLDGDGVYDDATGPTATWQPETTGDHVVGLRVRAAGQQDSVAFTYTVEQAEATLTAPTPVVDAPTTLAVGEVGTFDASGSTDQSVSDGDLVSGTITDYQWDFQNDGARDATGDVVTHAFDSPGEYTVNVTLTDAEGHQSHVLRNVTVIGQQDPVASFTYSPTAPHPDATITFDGGPSSDSDGDVQSYEWDFTGDGTVDATGEVVTHSFAAKDTYQVTLVVTDDDGNTNRTTNRIAVGSRERWTYATSNGITSSPTVVGNTVYVGAKDSLHAVNATTGERQWQIALGKYATSSPNVVAGTVYVGSRTRASDGSLTGHLYALDTETGAKQWSVETSGSGTSAPTVKYGTVYVGSRNGTIFAIDAETGTKRWQVSTGDRIKSSPTVVNGTVYVGSHDGYVYAIDAHSGAIEWQSPDGRLGWSFISSSPTVSNGTVYIGTGDGNLYALDAETGTQTWRFKTNGSIDASPTVYDRTVYFGSRDNHLYAVNAATGTEKWRFEGDDWMASSPTVANGTVYVGEQETGSRYYPANSLYAVDADTGTTLWSHGDDAITSSPTVANGTVYVGTWNGTLYALNTDGASSSEGSRVRLGTLGHNDKYSTEVATSPWISYSPPVVVGEPVTLNVSMMAESAGSDTSYEWDFDNDGQTDATGRAVTTTFDSAGPQTVSVTGMDASDTAEAATTTVDVTRVIRERRVDFSYNEEFKDIEQTADGGLVMAGRADRPMAGSSRADFWLLKTNRTGHVVLNRTYGIEGVSEVAMSVTETSDGYVMLGGDGKLVKVNRSGDRQWTASVDGWSQHEVMTTEDGDLLVLGEGVKKLNETGTVEWQSLDTVDYASDAIELPNGDYAVVGRANSYGSDDAYIARVAPNGTIRWRKHYGGEGHQHARSITRTADGGFAVAGWDDRTDSGDYQSWLFKTDVSGDLEWSYRGGGSENEYIRAVDRGVGGGFIMAGKSQSFGTGHRSGYMVKVIPDGQVAWNLTLDGGDFPDINAMTSTSDGDFVVVGRHGDTRDAWLVKVSGNEPVANQRPRLRYGNWTRRTEAGVATSLSVSPSFDPDGTVQSVHWSFDDGTTATGTQVTHTFTEAGTYAVEITLTDDDGTTVSTTRNVTVEAASETEPAPPLEIASDSSSIQPTLTASGETQTYDISVRVANLPTTGPGAVDVRLDGFTLASDSAGETVASGTDTVTIPYTESDIVDGRVTVSTTVTATAPQTAGVYHAVVTDVRHRNDSTGTLESRLSDPVPIGAIEVTKPQPDGDRVTVVPNETTLSPGETVTVNLSADTTADVYGASALLSYNSSVLRATSITRGGFLSQDGTPARLLIQTINNETGMVDIGITRLEADRGLNGSGTLVQVEFVVAETASPGSGSSLTLDRVTLANSNQQPVPVTTQNATVSVSSLNVNASVASQVNYAGSPIRIQANATGADIAQLEAGLNRPTAGPPETVPCTGGPPCGETVNVVPEQSSWNGSGYEPVTVAVTAETETGQTTTQTLTTTIRMAGDATGDGEVNIQDGVLVGQGWRATPNTSDYAASADLNNDGRINIFDAVVLGRSWQDTATTESTDSTDSTATQTTTNTTQDTAEG